MLVFATSDKGGTGRSVTGCNLMYRKALSGFDVCYLDFDFGSPTAGLIFDVAGVHHGSRAGGLHRYLQGSIEHPERIDVWSASDRASVRGRRPGSGGLVLYPGDSGGGEFAATPGAVDRCARLLRRLDEEFDIVLVDLSAGRSYATEIVLAATATGGLRGVTARWLVFHRWTRQHIMGAAGLIHDEQGIVASGVALGHEPEALGDAIRTIRTAVVDPNSPDLAGLRPSQVAWLRVCHQDLQELAGRLRVGRTLVLGSVPLDPMLQSREQLISDNDVLTRGIANQATLDAFITIGERLADPAAWERL